MTFILLFSGSITAAELHRDVGKTFVKVVHRQYHNELDVMGDCLQTFINNLDGFHDRIHDMFTKTSSYLPHFRCVRNTSNHVTIHIHPGCDVSRNFYAGFVDELNFIQEMKYPKIAIDGRDNESEFTHFAFNIQVATPEETSVNGGVAISGSASDLGISNGIFCNAFPFHFIVDRKLRVVQVGSGLERLLSHDHGVTGGNFRSYFSVIYPEIHVTFSAFLARVNARVELSIKPQHQKRWGETTVSLLTKL